MPDVCFVFYDFLFLFGMGLVRCAGDPGDADFKGGGV